MLSSSLFRTLPLLLLAGASSAEAQSFFFSGSPDKFLTPANRGAAGTEFSQWDVFYSPYITSVVNGVSYTDGYNYPDMAAPFGEGNTATGAGFTAPRNSSPGNPYAFFDTRNPTISQVAEPNAFIAQPSAGGNIYSPSGTEAFVLADTPAFTLGSVNMQWQTDGTLINFASVKLNYTDATGAHSISPANFITEYKATNSTFGFSFGNRASLQWNLTGLNISSYTITFQGRESSVSLQQVLLDTSSSYVESTPSTRAFTQAGSASWSNTANWAGGTLPAVRGNVNLNSGTGLILDGTSREISQLNLNANNNFALSATGSARLQVNTGITISPAAPATVTISAPLTLGAFNLWQFDANADVTINQAITGVGGYYKGGEGTLRITNPTASTFTGQVAYDGGTTYLSGNSSYSGGTSVLSGQVVLQGDAPASGTGVFGSAAGQIIIGGGGTQAAVVLDGSRNVGRQIILNNGTDTKILGAQSTGTGAFFSGSVVLGPTADNVQFRASQASDTLNFTGGITGGQTGTTAANTLTKTGAGVVSFDGSTKNFTYSSNTVVAQGTLQVQSGTTLGSAGSVTVNSGAALLVHGTLGGSGTPALNLQGGLLGGSGTVNRAFSLDNGDILSPGSHLVPASRVGKLTTSAETWGAGGRFHFDVASASGAAGAGYDTLDITGTLALVLSATSKLTIEVATLTGTGAFGTLSDFVPTNNYSWQFAKATSITGFNSAGFAFDLTGFANANSGNFSVSMVSNTLLLNYSAVPEPGIASLLLVGLAGWQLRRRPRSLRTELAERPPGTVFL